MNGNGVGARTLAHLRGETDLVREKERLSQVQKQFQSSGQPFGLSKAQKRRIDRFWQVASFLQENSRMSITEMSKKLKLPVSTIFDTIKEVEKHFLFTIVMGDVLSEWAYKSFWSSRIESETPAVAAWQGYMTPLIQILYGHVFPQQGCRG